MANIKQLKLPDNTTYDLKDDTGTLSSHLHHDEDLVPLISKTYASTSYYATANNYDNATWYFMSVKPDAWYKPWRVKFKVKTSCPNQANWYSYTWATYCGRTDGLIYANWNEQSTTAHTYITFYPLKQAGFNAGYGHAIGVSIYNGNAPTTASNYRTFEVDYYECENCTVTILDTPVKWASWPGAGTTNYGSLSAPNANSRGLQESGDSDTYDAILVYFGAKTGAQGIWAGSLFMQDGNKTYQNICTASDGTATNANRTTATTKLANTNGFLVGGTIYYSSANYNANTNISSWGSARSRMGQVFDARYSFNVTLTANSLTPYAPVYLVGTINSTDGLFYLDQVWWTQTPNAIDKIYILVGGVYDSTTSNCRMVLYENNPWYKYNGTKLVELTNGHTVNSDVPANAVFTDTTYESKQEAQGGTDLSLVTTGEKYAWNHSSGGTDEKVKQSPTTDNADYRVILSDSANDTEETAGVKKNSSLKYNPSTGNLQTTQLNGVAVGSSPKFTDENVTQTKTTSGDGYELLISGTATNSTATEYARKCEHFQVDASSGNLMVSRVHSGSSKQDSRIDIGNDKDSSTTTGSTRGYLRMYAADGKYSNLVPPEGQTNNRSYYLPVTDGNKTLAYQGENLSDFTDDTVLGDTVFQYERNDTTASTRNIHHIIYDPPNTGQNKLAVWKCSSLLWDSGNDNLYVSSHTHSSGTTDPKVLVGDTDTGSAHAATAEFSDLRKASLYLRGGAHINTSTTGSQVLVLAASTENDYRVKLGVWSNGSSNVWMFSPTKNGAIPLGAANYRWGQIYSTNSSISTSDRKEKKDIVSLDESAKDFIMALNPVSYKFKDGKSGRTHYGMIAQDVEEELAELGMSAMDFAGFCKDQKTIPYVDAEDDLKSMPVEGQYTYGLRYEEFMAPAIKTIQLLQNQVDTQQQEIDELKQQLAEIKAMLNGGN